MSKPGGGIVIKDAIVDITLQPVLTRTEDFDVIATLNLNGDYLSDALAAQVGGIGIAPGGNINYVTGHAVFEATHGTAPKRSEEHTSELQSLTNLVCRLLLEKKKKKKHRHNHTKNKDDK